MSKQELKKIAHEEPTKILKYQTKIKGSFFN
jgi:hypothetical protein